MQHALRLAARGLGNVWPNPSVGAVIVKDGVIVGRGWTARGGRPHAETIALAQAGAAAAGATLYVTLEPCAHHGKTPPCAEAIVAAGIARVVAACTDPNPQVCGRGFAMLRAAGIAVEEGLCAQEGQSLSTGFFSVTLRGRPFVTLKLATSRDGKIAHEDGRSRWITGEQSRLQGHALRASHDALLTGIGTALADDPLLTCRLPGREGDSPLRCVLDSRLRLPASARLLPARLFTLEADPVRAAALEKAGATIVTVAGENARPSLAEVLAVLAREGVTRLLVEAGQAVATDVLRRQLADRIYWFRAPSTIGEAGLAAFDGALPAAYVLHETRPSGEDTLEIYRKEA